MEAHVQLTGNVGGDVEFRNTSIPVASFRLACTPRIRKEGSWVDAPTTWLTVTCFRSLAEHVTSSVRRGDPVIVAGRLRTSQWSKEGVQYERLVLEATTVGHDLTFGTSAFHRAARPAPPPADRDADVVEVITSVESQTDHEPPEEAPEESAA
jgi:single-strand DNA-binding protein